MANTVTKNNFSSIGNSPLRHDGIDKVTGKAKYGADQQFPGMLYGKVLRSPYAHAIIENIDITAAIKHPDCKALVTYKDLQNIDDNQNNASAFVTSSNAGYTEVASKLITENVLARDKVFYVGHPILAVASSNIHTSQEILDLVKIKFKILKSVNNIDESLAPNSPQLHEGFTPPVHIEDKFSSHNITNHMQLSLGDYSSAINNCEKIFSDSYSTNTVHQGYIEPQNATAIWNNDNKLTIWCSSQGHFGIRDQVSKILNLPISSIRIVPMEIGGGFGGKLRSYLEPLAAILSKKSLRPVKVIMSRSEVLEATGPTSAAKLDVTIGITQNKIVAAKVKFFMEGGAFQGAPLGGAAASSFVPYNIPNIFVEGYDVSVNKPTSSAYRAPGAPIVTFGIESLVDDVANKLNINPLEFRLNNVSKEGVRRVNGLINPPIGAEEILLAIKNSTHYKSKKDKSTGRGIAIGFWGNGSGPACAIANVLPDGNISLIEGSVDIGGSRTVVAQQLAEILHIPVENINPQIGDTDAIGYTSNTGGSGVAFKSGWAAIEAGKDIKKQMLERASILLQVESSKLIYRKGCIENTSNPKQKLSFNEIAASSNQTGGPIVGSANINPAGAGGSFAAHIVDLSIDKDTGKIDISKITVLQDAGKAIHPNYVEGQMQGGTAQGIGWALNEEYFNNNEGKMINSTFLDYRMPISLDIPGIDTLIIEKFNPGHPFGVRGVGESSIITPMPAITNAVLDCIGVRYNTLPINPTAIYEKISK